MYDTIHISSRIIKNTRKTHQCFLCLRNFQPGSTLHYWVGKVEGTFSTSHICTTCYEIIKYDPENIFEEGHVLELLDKGETPEDYLNSLKLAPSYIDDNRSQFTYRTDHR